MCVLDYAVFWARKKACSVCHVVQVSFWHCYSTFSRRNILTVKRFSAGNSTLSEYSIYLSTLEELSHSLQERNLEWCKSAVTVVWTNQEMVPSPISCLLCLRKFKKAQSRCLCLSEDEDLGNFIFVNPTLQFWDLSSCKETILCQRVNKNRAIVNNLMFKSKVPSASVVGQTWFIFINHVINHKR